MLYTDWKWQNSVALDRFLNVSLNLSVSFIFSIGSHVTEVVPERKQLEFPAGVWYHPNHAFQLPEIKEFSCLGSISECECECESESEREFHIFDR